MNQLAAKTHVAWATGTVALFGASVCELPPGLHLSFAAWAPGDDTENSTVPVGMEPGPPVTVAVKVVVAPLTGLASNVSFTWVVAELTVCKRTPLLPPKAGSPV